MANMSVRLPICNGQDLEAGLEQVLPVDGTPVITDRAQAYAINMEFDRIRDVLMQDRALWEQHQYLYWWKKYQSYLIVCDRLDAALQEEFLNRMRQEFKRAMQLGQLRQSDFTASQWRNIRSMVDQACGYAGVRGALRKVSPYVPGFVKQGITGIIGLAAKKRDF